MLGVEHALSPSLGAVVSARYVNQGQGYLTGLFYPVNIDQMYNISASVGLNVYPFREFRGFYGNAEVDAGYHSTKTNEEHTFLWAQDSVKADGIFVSPAVKLGYKWAFRNRFSISPELGVSYTINTTDYSKISQLPSVDDEEAFTFSRRQMRIHNNGIHPFLTLQVGYRF